MAPSVLDVRLQPNNDVAAASLRASILIGLTQPSGRKFLPTLLLYDERGLRLYDTITTDVDEYYLFPIEERLLRDHGRAIVRAMHGPAGVVPGEVVLELGAGALRKTAHLLSSLAALVGPGPGTTPPAHRPPPVTYYALDLERRELVRTLNQITMQPSDTHHNNDTGGDYGALGAELAGKVDARGMWGTYDGAIQFIKQGGLDKVRAADAARAEDRSASAPNSIAASASTTESSTSPSNSSSASLPSSLSGPDSPSPHTATTPPSPTLSSAPDTPAAAAPLHIFFLGSTLGNFSRADMVKFLSSLPLRPGSGDTLLLGLDGNNGAALVEAAYDDAKGITREFILNGLRGAGRALGDETLFVEGKWRYVGRYNEELRRHEAYYESVGAQSLRIPGGDGEAGRGIVLDFADKELVSIEHSHKYSTEDVVALFSESNLRVIQQWTDMHRRYSLYLVERPPFHFPLIDERAHASQSPFGVPALREWCDLWGAWDAVSTEMIPSWMMHVKPIDLRHRCLFYLGHIPAFLDIHISRLLREPHTEPAYYTNIFERGIDPHVDDPTQCNPHSEVPEEDSAWPKLAEILDYRDRVRQRLTNMYYELESGRRTMTRRIARVLFMTLEHEGMHTETLLYMLIQRAGTGTLPPRRFAQPDFAALARAWDAEYTAYIASTTAPRTVVLEPQTVVLGHDDREAEDNTAAWGLDAKMDAKYAFGWDVESPKRALHVGRVAVTWRPVTNGEFFAHWMDADANCGPGKVGMPASWVVVPEEEKGEEGEEEAKGEECRVQGGRLCVRTLYGPVGFEHARHWPVVASYDDLSTYARVKGGRIPTVAELRAFWERYQNGFVGGGNVGFKNWHAVPATTGREKDGGRGHNGGVWEWTSTKLEEYEGYVRSELYPGYSSDFFDGKHQIVIGGSYATIPRIAQRSTFVNWYQHNYPYAWVGARIVYDA